MDKKAIRARSYVIDRGSSNKAIRDRINLIAHERGLPEAEVARAKTCTDDAILSFARRHGLSLDWLIMGDLKGLMRQAWRFRR
jgi:hypothetical protein